MFKVEGGYKKGREVERGDGNTSNNTVGPSPETKGFVQPRHSNFQFIVLGYYFLPTQITQSP